MDCFIRVFSSNELRLGMAIATVARWKMQKDVNVHVFFATDADKEKKTLPGFRVDFGCDTSRIPDCFNIPFATTSLQWAEKYSKSDPYIICNDDVLIYGPDFVQNGLRLMRENPDYGCISGVVTNGDQSEFELNHEGDVREIHAVGGCVFLRKGLVTEFPPLEDCYWDLERHRQIVAKGFKSGYSRHMPYLHMGARFSVANPAFHTGA